MTTENTEIKLISESSSNFSIVKPFTFTNYLLEQLPDFYAEKIVGTEQFRFLKYLNISEDIFDSIYSRIKKLYDSLDLSITHPKYLYLLGMLLGLTEIKDLSNSNDVEEIDKQRIYIKEAVNRLLIKGTDESILRLFYGLGSLVRFESLWTKNFETFFTDPDRFIKDFILGSDYSGIYEDDSQYYQGYIYADDYDLVSEINASLGLTSTISNISRVEINDYNYIYTLTNNGIYYKDSNSNWFLLSSSASDFKIFKDKIYIKDSNYLKIFKYNNLEAVTFSISGCSHIDLISSVSGKEYLFIDTGTQLQIRDSDYFTLLSTVNKLNSNPTTYIINKEGNDFIVWNTNNKELYNISLNEVTNTLSYPSSGITSYAGLITETIVDTKLIKIDDNWLGLFNITNTGQLIQLNSYFVGYSPGFGKTIISSSMNIKDIIKLDSQVLFYLSSTGIGVYYFKSNIIEREIVFLDNTTFEYNNIIKTNHLALGKTGNKYKFQDSQNKIYISKKHKTTNKLFIHKFYGIFNYGGKLFKTHYFNIVIEDAESIRPSTIQNLKELIKSVIPIHVHLNLIKYILSTLPESFSISDSLTLFSNYPLYADGNIEIDLIPTVVSWWCSGGQTADGTNQIQVVLL